MDTTWTSLLSKKLGPIKQLTSINGLIYYHGLSLSNCYLVPVINLFKSKKYEITEKYSCMKSVQCSVQQQQLQWQYYMKISSSNNKTICQILKWIYWNHPKYDLTLVLARNSQIANMSGNLFFFHIKWPCIT